MLAFTHQGSGCGAQEVRFSTSLDGDTLVYKQYFHIGFAADAPNGLVVPVLKDADKKGIFPDQPGNERTGQRPETASWARPT